MSVNLGDKCKDRVSGFVGVAMARHEYLNGCARITLQPEIKKDGKLPECQTFDEPQLTIVKKAVVPAPTKATKETGGPDKYADSGR